MVKKKIKKKSQNVQVWEDWSDEEAVEQHARIQRESGGGDYLDMRDGDNYYRFLPPPRGVRSPFVEVWQHFFGRDIPVPGREKALVYACPAKMENEPCLVCERAAELSRSRGKDDRELAKDMRPRLRVFANVIDMDNPDMGPQVLPFGKQVLDDLMAIRKDPRKGGNFTHPVSGFTIIVTKKGSGMNTKYSATPDMQGAEEIEDYDWIKDQIDLQDQKRLPSEEDETLAISAVDLASGGSSDGSRALPQQRGGGRRKLAEGSARGRRRRREETEEEESPRQRKRERRAKRGFVPKSTAQKAIDDDETY